uniref:Pentatricopeptide repeat-containing protein n=1 Tax=Davidia involucrata TaxID=16924 RepID=A0A5B7BMF1_DAVIN
MWRLCQRRPLVLTHQNVTTKTRPLPHRHYCSSQLTQQNEDSVREITTILKCNNWRALLDSSDVPKKLNPDVVQTVLHQNQVGDSKRLLDFFYWVEHKMGTHQDLNILSILAVNLCNS